MILLPAKLKRQLLENNLFPNDEHWPVVKLFLPGTGCTWLLTDMDQDEDRCFGLCDLGFGEPEMGYVLMSELEAIRSPLRLPVERDLHWTAKGTLIKYYEAARAAGRIVDTL